MKVAIWGSMNFGNFGDDVMNIMIGMRLKELGCKPYLFRLNSKLAEYYKLNTVQSTNELIRDASFVIIGGGSWLESTYLGKNYEDDCKELLFCLEKYKVPLHIVSIGGDKQNDFRLLSKERQALFNSVWFRGGTVRFEGDVDTLKPTSKPINYYPDIVLIANSVFLKEKVKKVSERGFSIGISSWNSKDLGYFLKLIKILNFFGAGHKVTFIRTHLEEYNQNYEYFPESMKNKTFQCYQYKDLESFYQFLNSLDFIISFKLHPGVAALSVDTPYFWIGGNKKVVAFLETIDKKDVIISYKRLIKYLIKGELSDIIKNYAFEEIKNAQEKSKNHILYVDSLVELYS